MKRFGLKAIAAALALTMVASLGVPATAKAAEEKLVTAASPKKGTVLEVTQSMVDSDGELVLSGESFDVVVIPNDIEVTRLYLDDCVIGELSIESGNNPEIQVWDTQIKDVTVVPAELVDENAALVEYVEFMLAQEDQEAIDVSGYMKEIVAKNAALSAKAPSIVLKGADMESSTQKIENLNLKASVKLDCSEGNMPAALNVAMEGGKQNVSITVKGFEGDMNVTQANTPDGQFAILNVKAEDSNFKNVDVAATGNGNVVLRSADSKVGTVNYTSVESTAPMVGTLSLDMDADKLVTDAKTSNASISVHSAVKEVAIDGNAVALSLGSAAKVTAATVAGKDNSISGTGTMTDCVIAEGSTASVIVPGAAVEGNNAEPVVSVPEPDLTPEEEARLPIVDGDTIQYNFVSLTFQNVPSWGQASGIRNNEDGSSTMYTTAGMQYKGARFYAPSDVDTSRVIGVEVSFSSNVQAQVGAFRASGQGATNYPGSTNGAVQVQSFQFDPKTDAFAYVHLANNTVNEGEVTLHCVKFILRPEGAEDIDITDIDLTLEGSSNPADAIVKNADGSSTIQCTVQYSGAIFNIPEGIDASKITEIKLEITSNCQANIAAVGENGNIGTNYPNWRQDAADTTVKTSTVIFGVTAENPLKHVVVATNSARESYVTLSKVTITVVNK